jgi:hypothetical protein
MGSILVIVAAVGLALALALGGVRAQDDTQKFFFYWPTTTSQCEVSCPSRFFGKVWTVR